MNTKGKRYAILLWLIGIIDIIYSCFQFSELDLDRYSDFFEVFSGACTLVHIAFGGIAYIVLGVIMFRDMDRDETGAYVAVGFLCISNLSFATIVLLILITIVHQISYKRMESDIKAQKYWKIPLLIEIIGSVFKTIGLVNEEELSFLAILAMIGACFLMYFVSKWALYDEELEKKNIFATVIDMIKGIISLTVALLRDLKKNPGKYSTAIVILVIVLVILLCYLIGVWFAEPDHTDPGECVACNGAGMYNDGFLDFKTCPACGGTGRRPI